MTANRVHPWCAKLLPGRSLQRPLPDAAAGTGFDETSHRCRYLGRFDETGIANALEMTTFVSKTADFQGRSAPELAWPWGPPARNFLDGGGPAGWGVEGGTIAPGCGLPSPFDRTKRLHAVLFDVDGTLYSQRLLQMLMMIELLALPVRRPLGWWRTWRTIAAYRSAQESLRVSNTARMSLAAQIETAATGAGVPPAEVEQIVREWMFERPLKYLRRCRAAGIPSLLNFLTRHGVAVGVLSDYPANGKLAALGLSDRFFPVLCSSDEEIGALKPDARGFLKASQLWGVSPSEVLVVGDRIEVDAAGAAAAGMPCVIIGRSSASTPRGGNILILPSFERLHRVLDGSR